MTKVCANTQQHPVVVVSFDDAYAERFTRELEKTCPTVHVSPLLRTLQESIESLQPSIIVFDLQTIKTEDHTIFEILALTHEAFPAARKIALGHQSLSAQVISAMKAGACDFLDRETSADELRESISWHLGQIRQVRGERAGHVIALVSGRENEGENELSANLAAYVASKTTNGDVLLLDLTLAESQLEIEFNVEVTYSVRNALDELLRLDRPVLLEVVARHSSGLRLLPLTTRNSKDDEISAQQLATLLSALRNFFSIIIINAGCLRDKYCQQYLLPLCDRLLLICPQMIGSIRAARGIVPDNSENLEQAAKFGLIVSKYDSEIQLNPAQIAARIGIPLVGTIPAAWAQLADSHNLGTPLVLSTPSNRYARAIRTLGDDLLGQYASAENPTKPEPSAGLFARFGSLRQAMH